MNFREEQKKRTEWTEEVIREFLPKESREWNGLQTPAGHGRAA